MSFSTGGLFITESVEVARAHVPRERWEGTMQTAMDEGATALPKSASNRRTLREISNRLLTLSEEDRTLLIDEVARAVCEAQVKMTWTWREERDMVRIERD